ncbi:MAG: type VI-A CRISPR-associated RNA-guided ribonuclease Cas13a [Bacteroidales bacterium]|jgi:hypothetical protein|nr:type VI-A CRISPR-associated RNA-guided ribonuclease Cas13a [Bacteroidales bacterium]
MRITKVKIENETVLINRTKEEGSLVLGENKENKTSDILPKKKEDSFYLSIRNQTISTKNKNKEIKDLIDKVIKGEKTMFPNNNKDYKLAPKFDNKDFAYFDKEKKETITFNLQNALTNKDINELNKYKQWVDWYIKTKSNFLIKSIRNNKLDASSKRKIELGKFCEEIKESGKLDLGKLEVAFDVTKLASALNKQYNEYVNAVRTIEEKEKEKKIAKLRSEFPLKIKEAFKQHRHNVFENIDKTYADRDKLNTYKLEVVKYLEHYFPVKRKTTRNRNIKDFNEYCEHYLDITTIKDTVKRQLENATRLFMLNEGRVTHKGIENNLNSQTLSEYKRKEGFVLNLINACAFAANNIRNIVDREQEKDILVKEYFIKSLAKDDPYPFDDSLFTMFYGRTGKKTLSLWAMRGAVQQIRNKAFHHKENAIDKIFNIQTFEYENGNEKSNPCFCTTIFKDCFEEDINNINSIIAEQLMSGGVLSYYDTEVLESMLPQVSFSLCRSSMPFTPSFKKVFRQGCDLMGKHLGVKNYNEYKGSTAEEQRQYQARYFFTKLLYNNVFLAEFTDEKNKDKFKDVVEKVIEDNKRNKKKKGNEDVFAFKEVRPMKDNESITGYLAYVQGEFVRLETLDKERNNFEKFLIYIFVKGFDNFLNKYEGVLNKPLGTPISMKKDDRADLDTIKEAIQYSKLSINPLQPSHIAFYTFCKLLDANHLSNLRNEMIKFRQSGINIEPFDDYKHLLETIELCLLKADAINKTDNKDEGRIKDFIDGKIEDYGELYQQQNSDTLITHSTIELVNKYGTKQRLLDVLKQKNEAKPTKNEYGQWKQQKTEIEGKVKRRDEIHLEWVKKKGKFSNTAKYQELATAIDNYNWLDNKLHLVHIRKLHSLLIDILGRYVGFVNLFDRDFQYFDAKFECKLPFEEGLPKVTNDKNKEKKGKNAKDDVYYRPKLFTSGFLCKTSDWRNTRNYIAHLNYLTNKDNPTYSLLELINRLRTMFEYDRKLKNAITTSIIKLFEKYGMKLTFEIDNSTHKFIKVEVVPDKILHLGGKVKTDKVNTEFCDMCKELLTMK